MAADSDQFLGDALGRQNEIHATGGGGGLRHGGESGGRHILRERDATGGLDGGDAGRAVRPGPRQDDSDPAASTLVGYRTQEAVDGHVGSRRFRAGSQDQRPAGHRQIDACRDDVNMVRFQSHAVGGFADGHGCGSRQNVSQKAVVFGVEMLHEYDGKSGVRRQVAEQALKNVQAAGGGADADHWYLP